MWHSGGWMSIPMDTTQEGAHHGANYSSLFFRCVSLMNVPLWSRSILAHAVVFWIMCHERMCRTERGSLGRVYATHIILDQADSILGPRTHCLSAIVDRVWLSPVHEIQSLFLPIRKCNHDRILFVRLCPRYVLFSHGRIGTTVPETSDLFCRGLY